MSTSLLTRDGRLFSAGRDGCTADGRPVVHIVGPGLGQGCCAVWSPVRMAWLYGDGSFASLHDVMRHIALVTS